MALSNKGRRLPLLLSVCGIAALASAALAQGAGSFGAQADAGREAYARYCAACHGDTLQGLTGPALRGNAFLGKWGQGARTAGDLYTYIHANMPPGTADQIPDETHAALLAFIRVEEFDYPGAAAIATVMLFASLAILILTSLAQSWYGRHLTRS